MVLDDQIEAEIKALVLEALKSLYKEGSIDLGRTVNNNYARLVTPEEPQQKTVNRKVILHKIK